MMIMNSYEDMIHHFKDQRVMTSTKQSLDALLRIICSLHTRGRSYFDMPVRVFLTSYMVSLYPTIVFEEMTPEATALKDASDKMTSQYNTISEALLRMQNRSNDIPFKELSKDFCENLLDYHNKFLIWQHLDEVRIISRILSTLSDLLLSMFRLGGHALDIDIINYDGTDQQLVQIKTKIILYRRKLKNINAAAVAEFDMRIDRETRAYRELHTILLRQEEEQLMQRRL